MSANTWSKEKRSAYNRQHYHARRLRIFALLGEDRCRTCSSTENLEIDHVDPTTKSFGISFTSRLTKETIEELKKCQALCRACHRAKSIEESRARMLAGGFTHGTIYAWMRRRCTCPLCLKAKWAWNDKRNSKRRTGKRGPYNTKRAGVA